MSQHRSRRGERAWMATIRRPAGPRRSGRLLLVLLTVIALIALVFAH